MKRKKYISESKMLEIVHRVGEQLRENLLDETSIPRILSHGENGFVVVSANKSKIHYDDPRLDLTPECKADLNIGEKEPIPKELGDKWLANRNEKAEAELNALIKQSGYAYKPSYGGYHEPGTNNVDSMEPSYIIYNHKRGKGDYENWEDLFRFAVAVCKRYKQDSVYVQAPGEPPIYVDMDGNKTNRTSTKNFKVNRNQEEYYTTNKRRHTEPKRFTADIKW